MRDVSKGLLVFAVTGAICVGAMQLRADDNDNHGPPPGGPGPQPVSLEHEMGAMNRAYKVVRTQVKDATKNASTLVALSELEQHTLVAKGIVPRSATTMPTAEANASKLADYQAMMLTTLQTELDLEEQIRANHNDKAAEMLNKLHGLEDDGHKEFRPKRGG